MEGGLWLWLIRLSLPESREWIHVVKRPHLSFSHLWLSSVKLLLLLFLNMKFLIFTFVFTLEDSNGFGAGLLSIWVDTSFISTAMQAFLTFKYYRENLLLLYYWCDCYVNTYSVLWNQCQKLLFEPGNTQNHFICNILGCDKCQNVPSKNKHHNC